MASISVVSSCLVPMALATNSVAISTMDLTPWDLQLIMFQPIQKGILFHNPKPTLDHLKNSLSRTLDYFPPLAGRLKALECGADSKTFVIDCNNAGVEFTHAVAGALSVSDILKPKYTPEIVASSFFPLNDTRNYEGVCRPLFGVQITELIDGYFIGCTANHAVIDGTSFWHFINCWSEISRGAQTISKYPVFDRDFPNPPISIPNFNHKKNDIVTSERVFHFSKESVAKLKAEANSETGTDKISSLQAVLAHLWRSIIRCRCPDETEESKLSLGIGARPRISLPDGYFGNCMYGAVVSSRVEEMLCNGLGFVALKINEVVRGQTSEAAMRFVEDWGKNEMKKERIDFMVGSTPRHNVYGNDFGWGKPIAVRSGKAQKFDGMIMVYPAAEAGGIDVEVCLLLQTLQAMENDAHFLQPFSFS